MSLADLMRKGSLRAFATATPATVATHGAGRTATVAEVATVAVAKLPGTMPANDAQPHVAPEAEAENASTARVLLFVARGLSNRDAEALAGRLAIRDRERDDRQLCIECSNFSGCASRCKCSAWRRAGIGGPALGDLATLPQRCVAFSDVEPAAARA